MADHTYWASPDIVDAGSCVLCGLPKEGHDTATDTESAPTKTSFYPSSDPLALTVEPAVGSVVLDFFGVAWQRIATNHAHIASQASRWCSTDYALGTEAWSSLVGMYGPVTAVHVIPGSEGSVLCRMQRRGYDKCKCREHYRHDGPHRCRCHGEWASGD